MYIARTACVCFLKKCFLDVPVIVWFPQDHIPSCFLGHASLTPLILLGFKVKIIEKTDHRDIGKSRTQTSDISVILEILLPP